MKKLVTATAIYVSVFSILLCICLLNMTKTSYAIETGTFTNGFPTTTFSTNVTSSQQIMNLVSSSFGTEHSYDSYMNNFKVNVNYYDNNNTNPLYVLMKNLELPKATESFELTTDSVNPVNDKGITYIINHGFNNTNTVNTVFTDYAHLNEQLDNNTKYYITQVALWLYIYENKSKFSTTYCKNTGAGYSACDFLDSSNNVIPYEDINNMLNAAMNLYDGKYIKYIAKLLNDVKNYTGNEESAMSSFSTNFNYSFTQDNSMIYIYNLKPSITGNSKNYMYYAVEVEDPNSYGVYIADKNGNKLTNTTQMTESFSVVIPIGDDITKMDLSSINIKVYAYFLLDNNKSYVVTSSTSSPLPGTTSNLVVKYGDNKYDRFADITLGYSPYQIISTQFRLDNFTRISKVDITNSKELPGAKLIVTKKDDETKKWSWVSTNTPHILDLDSGNYTLCETIAPDGYVPKTECIDFTVDGTKITTVTMENTPVEIPNTGKMFNRLIIFFGLLLVIAGGGILSYFVFYKKKLIKKEA